MLGHFNEHAGNPREFWQCIRQTAKLIKLCNDHTGDYLPSYQVSTYINTFFAELGPTLARAIPQVADVVSTQIYALVKSYENELHPECSIPVMTLE